MLPGGKTTIKPYMGKLSKQMGIIDASRWKKIIIASDNHGQMICRETEKKLFEVIKAWKPDIRGHLGDFMNLDPLRLGATEEEKRESMREDVAEGLDFLNRFRPDFITEGNHDWRLKRDLNSGDPFKREWCEDRVAEVAALAKKMKTKFLGWGVKCGVYEIAKQKMLHGYANGAMAATRTTGAKFGPCVHGHNHTGDIFWLDTYDYQGRFAQSCPSMCDNEKMSYQLGQTASFKHVSGFALGLADMKKNLYYPGFVVKTPNGFVMMEPKAI